MDGSQALITGTCCETFGLGGGPGGRGIGSLTDTFSAALGLSNLSTLGDSFPATVSSALCNAKMEKQRV